MNKILIVEDDKEMQDIYRDIFADQKEKYKIDIEGSAEQALAKIKKSKFDLIILDIIMGPMSGDAFLVRLRQGEAGKDTPVIIVTVLSPHTLGNLKNYADVVMLQKPVKKEAFLSQVQTLLSKSKKK